MLSGHTKVARTGKAARTASFNRVLLFLLWRFVFSIGVWDTKVAKTGKAARTASFNRVMLFLIKFLCSLLVFGTRKWPEQAEV